MLTECEVCPGVSIIIEHLDGYEVSDAGYIVVHTTTRTYRCPPEVTYQEVQEAIAYGILQAQINSKSLWGL